MSHQSISCTDTQSSVAHVIWVIDGESVFCRDKKPHAFERTQIDIDGLVNHGVDDMLGVIELLHFGVLTGEYLPLMLKKWTRHTTLMVSLSLIVMLWQ